MSSSKGEPMINRLAGFAALAGLALLITFPVWGQFYSQSRLANQYNANRPSAQNNSTGATPNSNPGAGGNTNSPAGQSNYGTPNGQSNYGTGSNPYGSPTSSYTTSQGTGYGDPYYGSGGYVTGPNGTQTGSGSIRALW